MTYVDPHIHMVSRTTDDYKRMALAGCVLVSEPAFWAGFDRSGAEGFRDYFRQLTDYERKRAALYGIEHRSENGERDMRDSVGDAAEALVELVGRMRGVFASKEVDQRCKENVGRGDALGRFTKNPLAR